MGQTNLNGSVRKAVEVLDALRESDRELSAREIAQRMELPKSTVQRLLQSLEAGDLVQQGAVSRKYTLGPGTLNLGMAYLRKVDVRGLARPHMVDLQERIGETVGLTIRVGSERVYVEQVETPAELRAKNEIGSPYPLWSGAPGRVLLAEMPREELFSCIAQVGDAAFAHVQPPTLDGLLAALETERSEGYAQAFEETIPGVNTVAAPVRDGSRKAVAVLSVSGPSTRFDAVHMRLAIEPLLGTASAISRQLGWLHPSEPVPHHGGTHLR